MAALLLPKWRVFLLSTPTADRMKGDTNQKLPATSKPVCAVIWFYFASSSSPLVINVEKKIVQPEKET